MLITRKFKLISNYLSTHCIQVPLFPVFFFIPLLLFVTVHELILLLFFSYFFFSVILLFQKSEFKFSNFQSLSAAHLSFNISYSHRSVNFITAQMFFSAWRYPYSQLISLSFSPCPSSALCYPDISLHQGLTSLTVLSSGQLNTRTKSENSHGYFFIPARRSSNSTIYV